MLSKFYENGIPESIKKADLDNYRQLIEDLINSRYPNAHRFLNQEEVIRNMSRYNLIFVINSVFDSLELLPEGMSLKKCDMIFMHKTRSIPDPYLDVKRYSPLYRDQILDQTVVFFENIPTDFEEEIDIPESYSHQSGHIKETIKLKGRKAYIYVGADKKGQ